MPRLRFTRTPTEAEGGPGHPYLEGAEHDLPPASYRRWLDMEAGVPASIPAKVAAPLDMTLVHVETGEHVTDKVDLTPPFVPPPPLDAPPPVVAATEGNAASGGALVAATTADFYAVEAGGEAPPIVVPAENVAEPTKPKRELRAIGNGRYHVYEDGKQISKQPMRKFDADAMVEHGVDAPAPVAR